MKMWEPPGCMASMSNIEALVPCPAARTMDWPGLRMLFSTSARLTQLICSRPSGAIQGAESSATALGATTAADWVSGVNHVSVPAWRTGAAASAAPIMTLNWLVMLIW